MKLWALLTAIGVVLATNVSLSAQEPFYKGKVLRIAVGYPPGTGFDNYSRAIARNMGKHIPGNPTIIVENMPGAGGLVLANLLFKATKPDGLTIGTFLGGLVAAQVLGRPGIEFDGVKFGYIGVPLKDINVCTLTKASGITSLEKWLASKEPVKLGAVATGAGIDAFPRILREVLGLPIRLVTGYKGTAEIRMAAEGGEVAGGCWSWGSVRATWTRALRAGEVLVVVQNRPQPHPELSTVPLAIDLAKTREARELVEVGDPSSITFTYALPPGSPGDRLQTLRRAFIDTMKDPEFLKDAEKSLLAIDPMAGDELERTVARLFKMEPALVTKLKEVLATN